MPKPPNLKPIAFLPLWLLLCLGVGWLGGLATESSRTTWYAALQKPPLNPPDWVFAPVWITLYVFMAIAGWRLWGGSPQAAGRARSLFFFQLVLNGVWSFLFFGLRNPGLALIDIALLWAILLLWVQTAWREDKFSACLLAPYFLWVSFAVYLNAALWWLNR